MDFQFPRIFQRSKIERARNVASLSVLFFIRNFKHFTQDFVWIHVWNMSCTPRSSAHSFFSSIHHTTPSPHIPPSSPIFISTSTLAVSSPTHLPIRKHEWSISWIPFRSWLENHVMAQVYLFRISLSSDIEQKWSFPVLGLLHSTR